MAHDVFLSHSSKDKAIADAAVACIESRKIRCWVAPRDIVAGSDWSESIIDGINGASVMVLILSENSNVSKQVLREIERAANRGIPILPFRVADIELSKSLEYFLSSAHWLDAYQGKVKDNIEILANNVANVLERQDAIVDVRPSKVSGKKLPLKWIAITMLLAVSTTVFFLWQSSNKKIAIQNAGIKQNLETSNPAATVNQDDSYNNVEPDPANKQNTRNVNNFASESPLISVEHFRTDSTGAPVRYGQIGSNGKQPVNLSDLVRLTVDLNEPQHILLLAFNPDGKVQLCYPEQAQDRFTKKQTIEFPSEKDLYFALTDGRGQQAFVVLTSNELIPDFEKLGNQLESVGWDTNDSGGIWEFDGTEVSQIFSDRIERGTIKRFTASHFKVVCDALTNMQPGTNIYGIAFQVQ